MKIVYQTENKLLLLLILLVNPSVIMVYYWQNKPLVNSSVNICILPTELNHWKITSTSGKSCNCFLTLWNSSRNLVRRSFQIPLIILSLLYLILKKQFKKTIKIKKTNFLLLIIKILLNIIYLADISWRRRRIFTGIRRATRLTASTNEGCQ
jgi:hypothetical protein